MPLMPQQGMMPPPGMAPPGMAPPGMGGPPPMGPPGMGGPPPGAQPARSKMPSAERAKMMWDLAREGYEDDTDDVTSQPWAQILAILAKIRASEQKLSDQAMGGGAGALTMLRRGA